MSIYEFKMKMMYKLIELIPPRLKYFIFFDVLGYVTTHQFSNVEVNNIKAVDVVTSYAESHSIDQ